MTEREARQIAFGIVTSHGPCLVDDEPLDELINDIARAIFLAFQAGKEARTVDGRPRPYD
jgi:hypothetical protein